MATDQHFDHLAERFSRNIYDTRKGQLRLQLLQDDLTEVASTGSLYVLDAGGGLGQMSRWFAQQGHQVTLCDAAAPMLERAKQLNQAEQLESLIELVHQPIQPFCSSNPGPYDLILCHAVLEWVTQPQQLIETLTHQLAPGGRLSLMFYNQHSLVLKNALAGNFRKVMRADWRGDGNSLTPDQGQDPDEVQGWLESLGYSIEINAGLRCFFDYLPRKARENYSFDDIIEIERRFRHQLPYRQMARYIHMLAKLPG